MANRRNRAGFTLAEMMIAFAIFMMVSLGFSWGLISTLKTQHMASDHYRAMSIARNRLQRAKGLEFASLPLLAESMIRVDALGNTAPLGSYYRTTAVTNVATNCVQLVVAVHFTQPGGKLSAQPVTVITKIAEGM